MARFGLSERMEEVEASMFAENNDNIIDGFLNADKAKDSDVVYFEGKPEVVEDKNR